MHRGDPRLGQVLLLCLVEAVLGRFGAVPVSGVDPSWAMALAANWSVGVSLGRHTTTTAVLGTASSTRDKGAGAREVDLRAEARGNRGMATGKVAISRGRCREVPARCARGEDGARW